MSEVLAQTSPATIDPTPLLDSLRSTFASGKTRDLNWRRSQLEALQRLLGECEAEMFAALESDLGKHALESYTTEVSYVAEDTEYFRKNLKRWSRRRRVRTPLLGQPARSWVQPEPLGVVLVIGAWNYPIQLTLSVAAAAIAAGNCVVIKPSELAPATSSFLAGRVPEYIDKDCVTVFEGGIPETSALLEQRFDHILYTGGGHVGKIVMAAAAKHLTPVTLELGGKSPCLVMPDADLDATAKRIAWGKYTNAGQTCIAPDYILTDVDTEAELIPLLIKHIEAMFGDDPSQSESYGRMINTRHFERVAAMINSEQVVSGGRADAESLYIEPTVMAGVAADDPVMQEEIFGPVLPIVRANNLEDAIATISGGEKPLASYIFTNDKQAEAKFLEQVSSGNVCINDTMMFMTVKELPFGGVGASGMGAYSGRSGFDTFSHLKAVMKRGWWPDPDLRYAPFTKKKFRILRKIR